MRIFLISMLAVILAASFLVLSFPAYAPELALEEVKDDLIVDNRATTTEEQGKIVQDLKDQINSIKKTVKEIKTTPIPLPTPSPVPLPPAVKSSDIYAKALKASLNIFCIDNNANTYIFGSASIIHPKGYVLTNGHLAEHFLDENTDCTLRRGSPARNFARAKVVWLPDQTVKIGVSQIPERDVALLKITEFMDESIPTSDFEYFNLDENYALKPGETLYSLNYPSEFLGADTAVSNTNLVFTLGVVDSVLTVDEDDSNAEGAYLKGELSAQHGSSGGIFLDHQNGNIVGLFVGLTEGKTTAERRQFMFMSSYINRILIEEKGIGLSGFLSTNP